MATKTGGTPSSAHHPATLSNAGCSQSVVPAVSSNSNPDSTVVVSQPSKVTVEQNAATAQRILEDYLKKNAPPPRRKDTNYPFPPGLFQSEVDLEGSAQAYHYHIEGLDSNDLQQILNQVDADPFKPNNVFDDLDFDFFD